jgi:hypothetical protein
MNDKETLEIIRKMAYRAIGVDCMTNFWRAIDEEHHLKESGEYDRRKSQDEEDERIADRRQREAMGDDYAGESHE